MPRRMINENDSELDYRKYRICGKHFTDADRTCSRRLNDLAVPSLFLSDNSSCYTPEESRAESPKPGCSLTQATVPVLNTTTPVVYAVSMEDNYSLNTKNETSRQTRDNSACYTPRGSKAESRKAGCSFTQATVPVLNTTTPVDYAVSLEHNYSLNAKNQTSRKKRVSNPTTSVTGYRMAIKNLRREVYRLRKEHQHVFKRRLDNAKRLLLKPDLNEVVKKMTAAAKTFTMMQFKQTKKNKKGRRFTLDEKILSLSLYKKSPKCYALMAKLFTLPSSKSLKRLLISVKINPGTNNSILYENLKAQVNDLNTDNRVCSLIFDEMSITPNIQFDSSKDEIKGLVTHGKKNIGNHALVFMVKGLRKPFKQPVAYHFTNSLNKLDLKQLIIEVITKVNETGLIIVCTVCDQSTINVSSINDLINDSKRTLLRKGIEMEGDYFLVNSKKIIPIYDTPHLIKGIRNNLLTKHLIYFDFEEKTEKVIKWEFFQQLYLADKSFGELRCLQKITEEHVDPDKIKKMRVKTATQLFSHSVAVATEHLSARGVIPQENRSLIHFVLIIDQLFDSLNVSCVKESNGKIYTGAVRRNSVHHKLWDNATKMLKTVKFVKGTTETIPPSVKNFIKTIEGFQALWKILSQKYSFDYFLTRNVNQDPIENFFGNIRSYGVRNVAPNSVCFEGAYKSLLLNNYNSPHSTNSNCEQDNNTLLQNLKFFITEGSQSSSYVAEEKYINLREDIINEIEIDRRDHGQGNYVCGWVLKKCLEKIVKKCKTCRNDILSNEDNEENAFINAKEYFFNKKWLCYPSMALTNYFKEIQNLCVSHLKGDVHSDIKRNIKFYISIFIRHPFRCVIHKEVLNDYFIETSLNILIYSWCRNINRILSGKITNSDVTDELKVMAQMYYTKHKHLKTQK